MEQAPKIYPWPEGLENIPPGHPYFPIYDAEGKIVGVRNLTERELDMTCNDRVSIQWRTRPIDSLLGACNDEEL